MKKRYFKFLAVLFCMVSLASCLKEDVNNAIGTPSPYITIEDLIKLYRGSDLTLEPSQMQQARKITGIVISDAENKNLPAGTIVIQNKQRGRIKGMILSVGDASNIPYKIGDSVVVEIAGATLKRVNGSLQVTGVSLPKIQKIAEGLPVTAQQVSLGQLHTDFVNYEGTLVKIVGADITPTPAPGETYSGAKGLNDGSGGNVVLKTESSATFANNRVPANATFTGIAFYAVQAGTTPDTLRQIYVRNLADVENASGPLYAGYPEDFEVPDISAKPSYAAADVTLQTGIWRFDQAILANTAGRDRFNPAGKQCVRLQQNLKTSAYLQMNYDLPNGASKVTVSYGAYYTDAKSTWRLEYSQNKGVTWKQIGPDISDAPNGSKTATFLMNIEGPVRFRINKLGLGTTNGTTIFNGRLSIDDFAIYQN